MALSRHKKYLFELTPLGKAHKEVTTYISEVLSEEEMREYRKALDQYRHMKLIQIVIKGLFYASIITSVAATVGLENQFKIFQRIASYLGTSMLFVLFSVSSYITLIRRENYHVKREILVSRASIKKEKS